MRTFFLLVAALAGCSPGTPTDAPQAEASAGQGVAGVYERADPMTPGRICLSGTGADLRFGLATRGQAASNCTARGKVVRNGSALRLRIDGAPACDLSATLSDDALTLAAASGPECGYYCGAGAQLPAGAFARAGSTAADIRKVVDLVGEPLC